MNFKGHQGTLRNCFDWNSRNHECAELHSNTTGPGNSTGTWLRECCREAETEVLSNSRSKLLQTAYNYYFRAHFKRVNNAKIVIYFRLPCQRARTPPCTPGSRARRRARRRSTRSSCRRSQTRGLAQSSQLPMYSVLVPESELFLCLHRGW